MTIKMIEWLVCGAQTALPAVAAEDEPITRPLAYGYMRVPCDVPDAKVQRLEQALRAFAALQGLYLVTFFFEFDCGSQEGFGELLTELKRADAHHVVIPSLRHFARSTLLQNQMLGHLEFEAAAEVLVLRETA
ncbi:recombinase family protein [Amycolatopsis sp. NPDC051061]|uniref:recombinase family protein n=1 Tax=Amycolatopsis sp. NPDC051061 TaxID=3155042 RepID=UPI00342A34D5